MSILHVEYTWHLKGGAEHNVIQSIVAGSWQLAAGSTVAFIASCTSSILSSSHDTGTTALKHILLLVYGLCLLIYYEWIMVTCAQHLHA